HVFQRAMAGLTEYKTSDNDSFWSWRKLMYQYANNLDAKQLYDIACYAYSEMLQAGFSSVCEFHYIHRALTDANNSEDMSLAIMQAAHDVGIGLTILPVLYTQAHIDGSALSAQQQRFKLSTDEYVKLYKSLKNQCFPGQNIGLCFHSLRAVAINQITEILTQLADDQPIHIHISEQTAEVDQVQQHTGLRPVELLFKHFAVNEKWCLVHATHLNNKEVDLMTQSGAIAGLCPMTEANLGDGIFPLAEFIQLQGRYAIGSDSHILINPFQELQILEYSQRLKRQRRIIASTIDSPHVGTLLWNNAVAAGAQASGLNVNGIAVGQRANWLSINTKQALLTKLDGRQCLDVLIFANNQITSKTYILGQKYQGIAENISENYKNTLKSIR
ncbi:MAG TPA: formimidoylglutamate deiminase, partial [Oceanospirillales bacterium]|nr:formimidoylglutamate deiminase [Oceanospirillales bacterium]